MITITPNFNFDGKCCDAIKLYQKAFGAQITSFIRNGDATWEASYNDLSEKEKEYIYHAEICVGNQRIMMCDNVNVPFQPSASLSLTVTLDTKEEVIRAFDVMKEEGRIIYPLQSTPYS